MTLYDLLGHIAFTLIALSFLVRDILWLRIVAILASVFSSLYNYFALSEPLWLVIGWNSVFITINMVQIMLLLRERRGAILTELEAELYETVFPDFSKVQFKKLLRLSRWEIADPEQIIITEGQPLNNIRLVYSGLGKVEIQGNYIAPVRDGVFIGEAEFNSNRVASATITAVEKIRYLVWAKDDLKKLLARNPSMYGAIQAAFANTLARKLTEMNRKSLE